MNRPTTPDRLHALDAVRAGALLLGIVLHATMSFFFVVPARDVSQSTTLAVTFFVIHTFRMTLFFVIAGFFGRLLLQRRGVRAFVKDRARRVLVPLTAGWVILAPLTIAGCLFLFLNLPLDAMLVLPIWTGIGFLIYFGYSRSRSHLGKGIVEVHEDEAHDLAPHIPGIDDPDHKH